MNVKDLHLDAIDFKEAPTKTQLTNSLKSIYEFLNQLAGALVLDGAYTIADQPLGMMLNGAIQLKAATDHFEAGPNAAGLAVPQGGPQIVGRR